MLGNVSLCVPTRQEYDLGSAAEGIPCGRWSLWEMINFGLDGVFAAFLLVQQHLAHAFNEIQKGNGHQVIDAEYKLLTKGNLVYAHKKCGDWLLPSTDDRFARFWLAFDDPRCTYGHLATEIRPLIEQIEDDLKKERFYKYPRDKSLLLLRVPGDWNAALKAFPSTSQEIEEGVDCYALEHNTACVFHMMRVAEYGLRALARSLAVAFPKTGTPIEWAQWGALIDHIRIEGKKLADVLPIGEKRDAARDFYSGAVHHFEGFKDKYRNAVMHVRASYDDLDALRSINQVRDFMNGLSAKIGEKTKTPIRRWP